MDSSTKEDKEYVLPRKRPDKAHSLAIPRAISGIIPNDNLFRALFIYVTEVGQFVMADVLRVLYSQEYIMSTCGRMSVYNFCVVRFQWSAKETRRKFEHIGKAHKLLFCDLRKLKKVDLDFAKLVIKLICGSSFDCLSEECKSNIKLLMKYGFKIFKSYKYTDLNFEVEVKRFYEMVDSIYRNVGEEFEKNFKKSREFIRFIGIKFLNDKIHLLSPTCKKNIYLNKELQDDATVRVMHARKALELHYRRLEVSNPFTWMSDVLYSRIIRYQIQRIPLGEVNKGRAYIERLYTPLKIADSGATVDVKHFLTSTKKVGEEEVLPRVLLITGAVGVGKTALCYHLVQDWFNGTKMIDGLRDFDLVILLEKCKVQSQDLTEYLKKRLLRRTWIVYSHEDIIPFLDSMNVLFILDGYDEGPEHSSHVIPYILNHFRNKRILITAQPGSQIISNVVTTTRHQGITFQWLEASKMDDASQKAMAEAVYNRLRVNSEPILHRLSPFLDHFQDCRVWTRDLLRYPVAAALYIVHWEEYEAEIRTVTELYDAFYRLSLCKVAHRLSWDEIVCEKRLRPLLPICLGEIAWETLKLRTHKISNNALDNFKKTFILLRIDHYEVLLAFLACTFDRTLIPNRMSFSFTDRLQQAYYASQYLVNIALHSAIGLYNVQRGINWKKLPLVLLFMIGQLAARDVDDVALQLVLGLIYDAGFPAEDYTFWWNLYVEGGGRDCVSYYISNSGLPKSRWVLDATNVLPALRLLGSIPVELDSLTIDIPNNIDPYELPELLSAMEDLPLRLQDRYHMTKTIEVHLHFRQHYEKGGLHPSDDFLLALRPWATLVSFTGELGQEQIGREVILHPWYLRTIQVRAATVDATTMVCGVVKRLTRHCSPVHVNIAMPCTCDPSSLPAVHCPNLELHFPKVIMDNRSWVIGIIKAIGARTGVRSVWIRKCILDSEHLEMLIMRLVCIVTDKLSIGGVTVDDDEKQRLAKLADFTVSWT